MVKTKADYILRSLTKVSHKKWEFFIISRILHRLDDDELEFVTQQLVRKRDGRRFLTDLYFPALALHLEIDERHHLSAEEQDRRRAEDIIQATGHEIEHIRTVDDQKKEKPLKEIRAEADHFVDLIQEKKLELSNVGKFSPWDWEVRYSSVPIIKRGYLAVADNVTFRTQDEAMRCFGFTGKGYQRGAWTIPDGSKDVVWFPRLYEHFIWRNELSADGRHIFERALNDKGRASIAKQIKDAKARSDAKTIVFAKAKDALGANLLRYVGTFQLNISDSNADAIQFDRVRRRESVRIGY